jgi:hypothetical protein
MIEGRVRGKVEEKNGRFTWRAWVTFEKERVIANLGAGHQLVEEPENITVHSDGDFKTRELALADLHKHGDKIRGIIEETFKDAAAKHN